MPRTKRVAKRTLENVKPNTTLFVRGMVNTYLKDIEGKATISKINVETKSNQLMLKINAAHTEQFLKFGRYGGKTMNELKNISQKDNRTYDLTMKTMTMNSTKGNKRRSRSVSTGSKGRQSGAIFSTVRKQTRASRSLSRTQPTKPLRNCNTPLNNIPPTSYGLITPKVKPNTPHVLLRRPQHGEIAVSMQGSPLMVDHIMPNNRANVNIPLLDGRVISILPEKGLRTSEIPDIDPHLRRQIETLRDNLSQVLRGDL